MPTTLPVMPSESEMGEPDLQEFVCEDHIDLAKSSLNSPFDPNNLPACSPPGGGVCSPLWPTQRSSPHDCQPEFCKVPLCSASAESSPEAFKLPVQSDTDSKPAVFSSTTTATASEMKQRPGVKRTLTEPTDGDDDSEVPATSRNTRPKPTTKRSGRVPHSIIERRYRDNLNNQIEALRLLIPSVRETPQDVEDSLGIPPKAPSKAVVITAAASYIKELEAERAQRTAETKTLYEQVANLQQLLRCDNCSILQYLKSMQLENETEFS